MRSRAGQDWRWGLEEPERRCCHSRVGPGSGSRETGSQRREPAWGGLPALGGPTFSSPAPLPSSSLNLIVWDTDNPSVASHHAPIHICLKDPSKSPNQPQYPISQKHQQGLKPIVTKLLRQGLLRPTYSPYNTPSYLSKSQMAPITWSRT